MFHREPPVSFVDEGFETIYRRLHKQGYAPVLTLSREGVLVLVR